MILAVDPGLHGCGVSLWDRSELYAAAYVPGAAGKESAEVVVGTALDARDWAVARLSGDRVTQVVVEWPRIYPGEREKDPMNLLPLVGVGMAVCASFPSARFTRYFPAEWKGQLPKPVKVTDVYVVAERVTLRLSVPERARVVLPSALGLAHNVWDAIGIGLHHVGRGLLTHRRRVYPGAAGGPPIGSF